MTKDEIKREAPNGADAYFIDYDNSINYLKENSTMVYTRYMGWEESDTNYISEFEITPL